MALHHEESTRQLRHIRVLPYGETGISVKGCHGIFTADHSKLVSLLPCYVEPTTISRISLSSSAPSGTMNRSPSLKAAR